LSGPYELELECGGLYHSVHGLQLYRTRLFGAPESPAAADAGQTAAASQASDALPALDAAPVPPADR